MESSPIMSCQKEGEKVEVATDFFLLDSKVTAGGDCSHEVRGQTLLGRESVTNLDSVLKSRGITLPTKVRVVRAVVFPVGHMWLWELDHKKGSVPKELMPSNCGAGEDAWISWVARRSNNSIPKEINLDCSLERLMLKLQYFGHLMWIAYSLGRTLMLGKMEEKSSGRGWDG